MAKIKATNTLSIKDVKKAVKVLDKQKVAEKIVIPIHTDMADILAKSMGNTIDHYIFDSLRSIKYRNKRVPKYLKLPKLIIEWHEDYDEDYTEVIDKGILIKIEWFTTKIKIGREFIRVPYFPKGKKIKFVRYGQSKNKKIDTDSKI